MLMADLNEKSVCVRAHTTSSVSLHSSAPLTLDRLFEGHVLLLLLFWVKGKSVFPVEDNRGVHYSVGSLGREESVSSGENCCLTIEWATNIEHEMSRMMMLTRLNLAVPSLGIFSILGVILRV